MSGATCSTCKAALVWITVAAGPKLVCPRPACPGHMDKARGEA